MDNKRKIFFFGASVTHQSGDSGYYSKISINERYDFNRLSFPSSQLFNAGFFNVHKIFEMDTIHDIIFLEWSTTGENSYELHTLKYIVGIILKNNAHPVFLILPTHQNLVSRNSENLLFKVGVEWGVPVLDLRYKHESILIDCLRDGVHTNENGANLYANWILDFLDGFDYSSKPTFVNDESSKYIISSLTSKFLMMKGNVLELEFLKINHTSEISIIHRVGPFSPILEYYSDNDDLIWEKEFLDPWCRYERENFTTLIPNQILSKTNRMVRIKISDKLPDYSKVLKYEEKFLGERVMKLESLYFCNLTDVSVKIS